MVLFEPLRFRPMPMVKVWGGHRLGAFVGEALEADGPVGEVWQLVDRDGCSSVVACGTYAGRTLSGLMLSERESLLGASRPSEDGHFPILVKYIDAAQPLSVQVHPDPAAAATLGGESKDECWYVVGAEPGSQVYLGLAPGVDAKTFAAEVARHHVVGLLQAFTVRAGQFISVPAGTVHAIGGGVTLVEVQQNADTTYRIFDWERAGLDGAPRELHCKEALRSIDFGRAVEEPREPELDGGVNAAANLFDGEAFRLDLLRIHEPARFDTEGRAQVYVVLAGAGTLTTGREGGAWRMRRGETWLVPSSVGPHRFESVDGELEVLRAEARA